MKRWPLFLIAAPAAVAVWSGWVGLGQLCGFGLVEPLPGIAPWRIDTAITLPIGVEAYASYALGAWLVPGTPERARTFARRSAIGALALGMTGQVVYHLLAAAHAARAPWPVVVLVACLPVITLGFGVALAHLLRTGVGEATFAGSVPEGALGAFPEAFPGVSGGALEVTPETVPEMIPGTASSVPRTRSPRRSQERSPGRSPEPAGNGKQPGPVTLQRLREHYAGELEAGQVPSIRAIKRDWPVGYATASDLHDQMESAVITAANGHRPSDN